MGDTQYLASRVWDLKAEGAALAAALAAATAAGDTAVSLAAEAEVRLSPPRPACTAAGEGTRAVGKLTGLGSASFGWLNWPV
jgi:hypothetical protein